MMKGQEHLSVQKGLKSLWVYVMIPEVREDGFHTEYLQHWKTNQQNMNKATDVFLVYIESVTHMKTGIEYGEWVDSAFHKVSQ